MYQAMRGGGGYGLAPAQGQQEERREPRQSARMDRREAEPPGKRRAKMAMMLKHLTKKK